MNRRLLDRGLLATIAAMAATAAGAALARAFGVDLEVQGGETIPVSGVAAVTGFFSIVGLVLAAVLDRWSGDPTTWFLRVSVGLTAVSLVPPLLAAAGPGTAVTLVVLHLVAAAVVIPTLTRALGHRRPAARVGPESASTEPVVR